MRTPATRYARRGVLSRGLTLRGRCLLAGGIAATICAWLLDERDLVKVGLLATALPLAAWLLCAVRRPQVTVSHRCPEEWIRVGAPTQVDLEVRSRRRIAIREVALTDPGVPELSVGLQRRIRYLPRRGVLHASYPIHPQRRGRFTVGPAHLAFGDALGLWEDIRTQPDQTDILVVPAIHRLEGLPPRGGSRSAISGQSGTGTGTGEADVLLRPYSPGDDIRTINWRASARMDDLYVRLRQPVVDTSATLLLDSRQIAHRGLGAKSSLEYGISLAASVLVHLDSLGYSVRLCDHSGQVLIEGHDVTDQALAHLALLEPDISPDLVADPGEDGGFGSTGLVVAVLGELTCGPAAALAAARPRSARAIAFLLDVTAFAGGDHQPNTAVTDAQTVLNAAGWQTVRLGPETTPISAWKQACQQRVRAG